MEDVERRAAEIAGRLSQQRPLVRSIAAAAEKNNNLFDLQWRKYYHHQYGIFCCFCMIAIAC